MKVDSSPTCGIIEFSTSTKAKTQNIKKLFFTRDMEIETRNGKSNILTQSVRRTTRDLTKTLVSIQTDHSTSDQDFQCKELWNVSEPTTWYSRDGERMLQPSNSSSTQFQRPLDPNNGKTMVWKSKAMVEVLTLE
jgi:hypothetical protein